MLPSISSGAFGALRFRRQQRGDIPGTAGVGFSVMHDANHGDVRLLYGLFPLKWWFIDDLRELATGRISGHQFPPARGRELLDALAGKRCFVSWAFVLPAVLHP